MGAVALTTKCDMRLAKEGALCAVPAFCAHLCCGSRCAACAAASEDWNRGRDQKIDEQDILLACMPGDGRWDGADSAGHGRAFAKDAGALRLDQSGGMESCP